MVMEITNICTNAVFLDILITDLFMQLSCEVWEGLEQYETI